jgi:hypothetical protein
MYGAHARLTLPNVSGGSFFVSFTEAPSSSAAASAACPSPTGACAGAAGAGVVRLSKCQSRFGFQNCRKTAVTTREKMPPPMSVIG